jgi:hypothetical protein
MQYVGTFYNKEKLAALGVTDVSTIDTKDAFLAVLDQAKAAGEIPVMLGTSDKWPGLHNISLFNGWYVDPEVIKAWVFNVPGSTYETPGHLQGAADYRAWMANGYYNDDALATSFSDAVARFVGGEGVFYIGGTWALGDISAGLGEKAGFMLFPAGESGKHAAVGGYSLPWTISSKSPIPDCAAAFIDFVTASPEAIQTQIAAGRPSAALAGADVPIESPLLGHGEEFDRLTADRPLHLGGLADAIDVHADAVRGPAAPRRPDKPRGIRQADPGQLGRIHGLALDRPARCCGPVLLTGPPTGCRPEVHRRTAPGPAHSRRIAQRKGKTTPSWTRSSSPSLSIARCRTPASQMPRIVVVPAIALVHRRSTPARPSRTIMASTSQARDQTDGRRLSPFDGGRTYPARSAPIATIIQFRSRAASTRRSARCRSTRR